MTNSEKIVLTPAKPPSRTKTIIILLIVSVLFVVSGIFAMISTNKDKAYYRETTAVITSIVKRVEISKESSHYAEKTVEKTVHEAYVTYSVDGETFSDVKMPNYNIFMKEGQTVTVTYDYRNPSTLVASATSAMAISIGCIVAGVFLCLSTTVYSVILRTKKQKEAQRIQRLIETGVKTTAVVCSIINRDPLHFYCKADGHEYRSPKIKYTDDLYTGCLVDVYFDSDGYEERKAALKYHENYYIDLNSATKGPCE